MLSGRARRSPSCPRQWRLPCSPGEAALGDRLLREWRCGPGRAGHLGDAAIRPSCPPMWSGRRRPLRRSAAVGSGCRPSGGSTERRLSPIHPPLTQPRRSDAGFSTGTHTFACQPGAFLGVVPICAILCLNSIRRAAVIFQRGATSSFSAARVSEGGPRGQRDRAGGLHPPL